HISAFTRVFDALWGEGAHRARSTADHISSKHALAFCAVASSEEMLYVYGISIPTARPASTNASQVGGGIGMPSLVRCANVRAPRSPGNNTSVSDSARGMVLMAAAVSSTSDLNASG